jgi:hypothetical protein
MLKVQSQAKGASYIQCQIFINYFFIVKMDFEK